jgi:hypothetical protein
VDELAQQLQTLGWRLNRLEAAEPQSDDDESRGNMVISEAEAAFLLAAARVYQALGDEIPLPGHPPDDLLLWLSAELSHEQEAAASYLADETMKRLRMLLQGYDGLPAWYSPQQEKNPLATIRQALETKQLLEISYWTPACGQALERRVKPYFLEKRGDYAYLTGYCYLREDERVFRVDRILWAKVVAAE